MAAASSVAGGLIPLHRNRWTLAVVVPADWTDADRDHATTTAAGIRVVIVAEHQRVRQGLQAVRGSAEDVANGQTNVESSCRRRPWPTTSR